MRKKIAIFHLSAFPFYSGGIDTWLYNLLTSLDGKYEIVVYCPNPSEIAKDPIFDLSALNTSKIEYIGNFNSYPSMVTWSLKIFIYLFNRVDKNSKILVLSTIPSFFSVILLKLTGKIRGEIICSVRGQIARDAVDLKKNFVFRKATKLIEGICLKFADRVIANGWDTQDYLLEYYNTDSIVIPNGYKPRKREKSSGDEDFQEFNLIKESGKKIFVHVGTVRKVKGIDYILEAIKLMDPLSRSTACFIFVGKGQIDYYRQRALDLNIQAYFIGERQILEPYYTLADYVINVSGGSGVSNSLIEALSFGKPVIAWDNKTFSQVIKSGYNGILCNHFDSSKLSNAFQDAVNGQTFSQEIIKSSVSKFHWDNVLSFWVEILDN